MHVVDRDSAPKPFCRGTQYPRVMQFAPAWRWHTHLRGADSLALAAVAA